MSKFLAKEFLWNLFGFVCLILFLCSIVVLSTWHNLTANKSDCEKIGQQFGGESTLKVMPDGVHDLCFVKTKEGQSIIVQLR